ncbi:hypothetical protein [Actinoplanes sp. NPDC026619]|uniref:hypothetical protein n=1 Tax=Actinoplanes sp. NPDC026619 TaxID=3155798 RepID=UPI0033C35F56
MLLFAADAPTWTDKLEAWATVAAALFSAAALFVALWVLRREQRTRHEDKLDADAAQARLVFGKVIDLDRESEIGWGGVTFVIVNNSSAAIMDVSVTAHRKNHLVDGGSIRLETVRAHDSSRESIRLRKPVLRADFNRAQASQLARQIEIVVTFVDSAGRMWTRVDRREPFRRRRATREPGLPQMLIAFFYVDRPFVWAATRIRDRQARLAVGLQGRLLDRDRGTYRQRVGFNDDPYL